MATFLRLVHVALILCLGYGLLADDARGGEKTAGEISYRKSWLYIDACCNTRVLVEGEKWEIPVDYYLDPAEDRGGTSLGMWIAGPFVYLPDGKYAKKRGHMSFGVSMSRSAKVKAGRGRHTFEYVVPPALPRNSLLILCYFKDAKGKRWPWEVRRGTMWFQRKGGFFELESDKPGNLFVYEEPVRIVAKLKNVRKAGERRTLVYKVHDVTGATVAEGKREFTVERTGQDVAVELDLSRRGVFLIEAEVAGWEKRATTFCRIPDVLRITKGARTAFGMTNVVGPQPLDRLEEKCRIARRLGLTSCRRFTRWYELEPGPGVYKLDAWEKALSVGSKHGIDTWLCIWSPPAWALRGPGKRFKYSYSAFRCDWAAWRDFVGTVTGRLRGKFYGWEWLNEITPGGTDDAVHDYVTLCRIGTETAKAVDPKLKTILAGGLWPRSFRLEMLKAGVGKYIDVMPVHYSNGSGVREAREDLDSAGCSHVTVWDDETAKGINAWNVPAMVDLMDTRQCEWVLSQWPDELAAGCERIIYFGGGGNPCGSYSYILDDLSPRPVAATLAVFTSKMFAAEPVGVFSLGKGGIFHLFDRRGQPVLVCSSHVRGEEVRLHVGADRVRVTDYQGNERDVASPAGVASLQLAPLGYFVEGADLDVLKAYVAASIETPRAALKRSHLVETPRVTLLRGRSESLPVKLSNPYSRDLAGTFEIALPKGWPSPGTVSFSVPPGSTRMLPVSLISPDTAADQDYPVEVRFRFSWAKLPAITKPLVISVFSADMMGNLLPNGDFEAANRAGNGPDGWSAARNVTAWTRAEGLGDGLGLHVLEFGNTRNNWGWCGRTIDLRGGQTYLYTAWIWNHHMAAGSNVTLYMADGSKKTLYTNQVFQAGTDNPYWQIYTCRLKTPDNLTRAGFSPVVKGHGWARFDNVRVTRFTGTDFAAECHRASAPVNIDARLDEWVKSCPIPLMGRNQLTVVAPKYAWTPQNLSAVGYLMWDDANLYVALKVSDQRHCATGTDEATVQGDSFVLAFDPSNRQPGADSKAFAYYLCSANPGGGSGKHTIFRPAERCGGLRSGQLLKDSSVYDMAIVQRDGTCVYELRIPFGELGRVQPAVGARFGLSIRVNDNDGRGLAAHMDWGEGISPSWCPARLGTVTLVE